MGQRDSKYVEWINTYAFAPAISAALDSDFYQYTLLVNAVDTFIAGPDKIPLTIGLVASFKRSQIRNVPRNGYWKYFYRFD
jgi:hypothetical protein